MKTHRTTRPPTGAQVWLTLWKASHAVETRALESIEHTGLCFSDFGVLEALLHKGPLPVSVIGQKVLLTTGSITTAVDRLAERGLVERKPDPRDGRVRLVWLTRKGRALIEPAFARHAADLNRLVSVLSGQDRETLVALLIRLGTHAEQLERTTKNEDPG